VEKREHTRTVKLIHTSDVHLGCSYSGALARMAISAVVDTALALDADAMLLAGDIFDYNRVPESEVEFLLGELARFGRPSVILPGNHDCLLSGSVYHRPAFRERPANVHVIEEIPQQSIEIPELDLEVWGRPVVDHWRQFRPLIEMPPRRNGRWRVAMGHGHFEYPDDRDGRSSPIFADDIAALDCDYVALGHWDRFVEVSQGDVTAFYSGAPHWAGTHKALSHVALVTLDPVHGVTVQRHPLVAD
jgi:DNA repair exonuclease SbcCD nuclease subunit